MPQAGWYPDPAGSQQVRYWDGAHWTEFLSPAAPPPPSTAWANWPSEPPTTWKGQTLGLPASGPGSLGAIERRFLAALLDGLILAPVAIVYLVLSFPRFVTETDVNGGFHFRTVSRHVPLAVVLLTWLPAAVYTVALIATRGQTIGKKVLKLRVVPLRDLTTDADLHRPPGLDIAVRRYLLPGAFGIAAGLRTITPVLASLVQLPLLLDYLWALWDPNRQCLHDKIADVVVIDVDDRVAAPVPVWPAAT